jgi:hypothetical protein
MSDTRLTINLPKFGLPVTFVYYTGTVCPCVAGGGFGSYSPQWHIDNPSDEDCAGKMLIDTTTNTESLYVEANDIRALVNTLTLSSEILDAIGLLKKVDLAVIGSANSSGEYVDCTGHDEHDSYWTINGVTYVTAREFPQFGNEFLGNLFILARKS